VVCDLIAVGEFAPFDALAGQGEIEHFLGRLGVGRVSLLVASHVCELMKGEFAGHR